MRVQEYVLLQKVRDNIWGISAVDVSQGTDEEKDAYFSQMKTVQGILADQRKKTEGLDLGIAEGSSTNVGHAMRVRDAYLQQQ